VLSVISKTIRNLYVNEEAYFPLNSPESGWVWRDGSNGLTTSLFKNSMYACRGFGSLFNIFRAFLRYNAVYSTFFFIKNCLYRIVNRFICDGRFFFSLQGLFYKCLPLRFLFSKKGSEVIHFLNLLFRKPEKYLFKRVYFVSCSFHINIIANKELL